MGVAGSPAAVAAGGAGAVTAVGGELSAAAGGAGGVLEGATEAAAAGGEPPNMSCSVGRSCARTKPPNNIHDSAAPEHARAERRNTQRALLSSHALVNKLGSSAFRSTALIRISVEFCFSTSS